jgi:hypothetical protein
MYDIMRVAALVILLESGFETVLCHEQLECTTAEMMDIEDIVKTCCESVEGNCQESFPATCAHTCASLAVPYADSCGSLLTLMGDDMFSAFKVTAFTTFSEACRQTLVLYEHADAGSCTDSGSAISGGLQTRVDAVTAACCEQDGINTCTSGAPATCDAECAAEFLPYFEECLGEQSVIGGDMHQFTLLYTACTDGLPDAESLALYRDVTSLDDSPECTVDTTLIVSRAAAKASKIKPICDHDAFPVCNRMITTGAKSCKVNYCETCPEVPSPPNQYIVIRHLSHLVLLMA